MRQILPILLLGLAACQPPSNSGAEKFAGADTLPASDEVEESSNVPIAALGDLIGEYRVAGIDGEPLDADFGIALSIDGPMISFEPTCAGFVWHIEFEDGNLVPERENTRNLEPGAPSPPVCAIGIHPVQVQLATALDAATRVVRTPENAVVLSGRDHSVTLFRQ